MQKGKVEKKLTQTVLNVTKVIVRLPCKSDCRYVVQETQVLTNCIKRYVVSSCCPTHNLCSHLFIAYVTYSLLSQEVSLCGAERSEKSMSLQVISVAHANHLLKPIMKAVSFNCTR